MINEPITQAHPWNSIEILTKGLHALKEQVKKAKMISPNVLRKSLSQRQMKLGSTMKRIMWRKTQ
jgi:hypothetical protein